jgi:hypothetical protein
MASCYKPKERVLMQAAELLRQPYYADDTTAWVLKLIARRIEQLAVIADDVTQLVASRQRAAQFAAEGDGLSAGGTGTV